MLCSNGGLKTISERGSREFKKKKTFYKNIMYDKILALLVNKISHKELAIAKTNIYENNKENNQQNTKNYIYQNYIYVSFFIESTKFQ